MIDTGSGKRCRRGNGGSGCIRAIPNHRVYLWGCDSDTYRQSEESSPSFEIMIAPRDGSSERPERHSRSNRRTMSEVGAMCSENRKAVELAVRSRDLTTDESKAGTLYDDQGPILNGGSSEREGFERDCICLVLDDIRLLFQRPEIDPLRGSYDGLSGMDLIMRQLSQSRRSSPRLRLEIILPEAGVSPGMSAQVERSVVSYCKARATQLERKLNDNRREAHRALLTGSIFLAVCLLLSSLIDEISPFTPFLNRLFSESFLIAGWVAMWRPMELYLYEWWPLRRELDVYEQIGRMQLSITATPDPGSHMVSANDTCPAPVPER